MMLQAGEVDGESFTPESILQMCDDVCIFLVACLVDYVLAAEAIWCLASSV